MKLHRLKTFFAITIAASSLFSSVPTRPFPQKVNFENVLTPEGSREQQASTVSSFYDNWKNSYVTELAFTSGSIEPTGTGYVIAAGTNPSEIEGFGTTVTQSEAHGWGMIVTVLMAGHDSDAQDIFDGLYRVYRNWPSSTHNDLMSWAVPKNGAFTPSRRLPSATDGDMDAAYALLLAHEQWGGNPDGCDYSYAEAALKIIRALEENNILYAPEEAPNASQFPRLGIGDNTKNYFAYRATRSSDFMLSHFRLFHSVRSADAGYRTTGYSVPNVWLQIEKTCLEAIDLLQSSHTGLMPDFMGNKNGDFSQPISTFQGISDEPLNFPGQNDNRYWYNACRFPWRVAQGFIHNGIEEARTAVLPINSWLLTTEIHEEWGWFDPSQIKSGYHLNGTVIEGYDFFDKSFVAPFMTALAVGDDSWYVNDLWQSVTLFKWPTAGTSEGYYDNTIALLTTLLVSGNWWYPTVDDAVSITEQTTSKAFTDYSIQTAAGTITLQGLVAGEQVHLIDLKGRQVASETVSSVGTVSLSATSTGIFIVQSDRFSFKSFLTTGN